MFEMRRSARIRNKQSRQSQQPNQLAGQSENVVLSSFPVSAHMGSMFTKPHPEEVVSPPSMQMFPESYPTPPNAPLKPSKMQNYKHLLKTGSCDWVMCLDENDNEYFVNLKTSEVSNKCKEFFSNKMQQREVCILELKRRNSMQKRELHRYRVREYESHLKNGGDVNSEFEYDKGDKVIYMKKSDDVPKVVTIVDVHYDVPRFYTIQYNEDDVDVTVEKNTTTENLYRLE
jgi:hypothetical protein